MPLETALLKQGRWPTLDAMPGALHRLSLRRPRLFGRHGKAALSAGRYGDDRGGQGSPCLCQDSCPEDQGFPALPTFC